MIIDSHIHFFTDDLAPRARARLASTAGVPCLTDMTEESTRQYLADNGIDFGVMAPIATKPSQENTINDWAAEINHGSIISFGTIYPGGGDPEQQVRAIVDRGLRGIKLHPDYQNFFVDETAVYPLYAAISDAGLPVLFHAGRDPVSPAVTHCTPSMLRRISEIFPDLKIIGAHLGGNMMYDAVERDLVGENVYLDISMAVMFADPEQFARIVHRHGADRILFGTDTPWSSPAQTLAFLSDVGLDEEEMSHVLWQNAAQLLGFDRESLKQRAAE